MGNKLRVGIIGCGEATQAIHRPTLLGLADMFTISACTDVWKEGAQTFAASTGSRVFDDPLALIESDMVDVLLVAAPDAFHAEYVIAACEAGKKAVLVEKPLTMNVRMAKEVASRVERYKTPVVVGYPHLFDPAVVQAEKMWAGRSIVLGEFRTVLGPNPEFVSDVIQVQQPATPGSMMEKILTYALAATEPLGTAVGLADVMSYGYAIGLNIHDIPVIRRLLGEPDEITFSERVGEAGLHVGLRFGTGRVYLTSAIQATREIDWGFSLRANDCSVKVAYPSTYSTTGSSECAFSSPSEGGIQEVRWKGSYVTGFRREWQHVHALANGAPDNVAGLLSAVRDLEICEEIIRRMR